MKITTVRAIIAIAVVGVFMFITAFLAIYPLVTDTDVSLGDYSDFFVKTASVYTGILGVIIGYYFARSSKSNDDETQEKPPKAAPVDASKPH